MCFVHICIFPFNNLNNLTLKKTVFTHFIMLSHFCSPKSSVPHVNGVSGHQTVNTCYFIISKSWQISTTCMLKALWKHNNSATKANHSKFLESVFSSLKVPDVNFLGDTKSLCGNRKQLFSLFFVDIFLDKFPHV